MNKIFKTKYDVTTGQTKVVSELASNRQLASSSEKTPKCGGISGSFVGAFKLLPLAFLLTGSFVYGQDINIVLSGLTAEESKIGPSEILNDNGGNKKVSFITKVGEKSILLAPGSKSVINRRMRSWGSAGGSITVDTNNWMYIQKTVVIGHRARSNGNNAVAIGEQAFAASNSTSLGSEAIAYGKETVALGMRSYAEQTDDVALGHRAYAKGSLSTALGAHSSVESQKAVAIGYRAKVDHQHTDAIALGAESEADSPLSGSFMITKDDKSDAKEKTWISEDFAKKFESGKLGGALSIGKMGTKYRQIVNVAPGTEDTHAVNLGQLREAMKNAGGGGVSYFSTHKLTAMTNKDNMGAKAEKSLAIGVAETEMQGTSSIVIGTANDDGTNTSNSNSQFTKSSGKAAVAIGSIATVEADYGIALGKMAKIHTDATAAIALGKGAETKAAGAVAIGEGASVSTNAGDSIALGKNSVAATKKLAPTGTTQNVGKDDVKISWNNAGGGQMKSVVSVGNKNAERLITHVAAGEVTDSSTDAINGGQLYNVIHTFGHLGISILGAEKADSDGDGFKMPTFAKLKDASGSDSNSKTPSTFKDAIDKNIAKLNEGLKFKGDTNGSGGSNSEQQLYLGSTLTIKGATGPASKPSAVSNAGSTSSGTTNNHQNIFTTAKDTGILEIALNEELKGIKSIENNGTKIELKNNGGKKKIELTPENGATLTLTKDSTNGGNHVKATGLSHVGLSNDNALIFKNNGSKSAELKVGSTTYNFTETGLDLGNKKLTALASGLNLNGAGSGAGGNGNEEIIKKILEGNPDGTTSGGNSGTSIANNAVNVKDLSTVAKAIVDKGLTFAGNSGSDINAALGDKITIKGDGTYLTSKAKNGTSNSKEITFSLTDKVTNKLAIINVGTNNNGDNSFALGKNSTWEGKTTAATGADINVGSASLKFDWTSAGAGTNKEVVSVGSSGAERIIKHVAAGKVDTGSTEAINGGQLKGVIDVFGYLGTDVLGADVDNNTKKFTKTTFTKLKNENGLDGDTVKAATTFKEAIEKSIETINKGLKFKGDTGNEITRQLGSTLTITGAKGDASSPATSSSAGQGSSSVGTDSHQNIFTTAKDTGILEIALNKDLKGISSIGKDGDNVLTFANGASGTSGGNSAVLKVGGASLTFTKSDDNKVKISGIADGSAENDAVTVKQLTASQLHYLSVMGTEKNGGSNYNNDGAKGDKSIAIGVGASTGENGQGIGAVALGSGAEVKSEYGVAIGHGTIVGTGAKNSIAISATKDNDKGSLQNAEWAVSIGNKNNVSGGNDIVALGANIEVTGSNNDSVLVFGNGANATSAKESVVIGASAKAESGVTQAVIIGKGAIAKTNAIGAVAIGDGATVETAAGDSVALGKGSKAEAKETAFASAEVFADSHSLKFDWKNAGTSTSTDEQYKKSVLSIGDTGAERIIKHVAAGKLTESSTDAVNAGQLYSVAQVFSVLGINILGAEKNDDDKFGFKQSKFTAVQYTRTPQGTQQGTQQGQPTAPTTFREAINESITAINKGLMFKGDMPSAGTNGTQNTPHYLGSTLSIVKLNNGTNAGTQQPAIQDISTSYKGDNLITRYTSDNGNAKIEIGFKNAPTFEKVTLSQEQMYDGGSGTGGNAVDSKELITKGYLEQALNKFKFKVVNGNGQTVEIGRGDTLKFENGQNIKVTVANGNATQASASASVPAPTPAAPAAAPSPAPAATPSPTTTSTMSSASSTTTATTTPTTGTTTAPTTAVVTIATTEKLENISSISSKPKNGSAGGNSGSSAAGNQDEVTKLTLEAEKGATFQVGNQGAKVNINKEGITLNKANSAGGANSSNTPAIAIKVGSTASGSDTSNNGPAIEFAKGTDNKQGTGKITGLKDLEANSDGTSAVNKNYVDKLDKVTVKYDDEHKKSITLGGKPQNGGKAHDPVAINNLKSGLGLDDMKDKPDSQKNGLSLELVKKLVSNGISSQQGQQMTEQDLHKAANLADLKAVAQAGLRFKGNQGDDVVRKISDTLTIKGEEETQNGQATSSFSSAAGNIKVETNTAKDGLEIKLSDTLKNMKAFETKEEGGKKSTLNSDGLTVVNKNGSNKDKSATYGADNIMLEDKKTGNKATITAESLTFADNVAQNQQNPMPKAVLNKNGLTVTGKGGEIKIDGEKGIITVPDIKPTTSGSVVVNKNYVDGKNNELRTQINTASRESRAGIAGALAAAGLPMSSVPGKSMFAASAGTFKGQNALALGYSRVSDNGKITLRLQGTRSSTGDVGGSVGVGYQW